MLTEFALVKLVIISRLLFERKRAINQDEVNTSSQPKTKIAKLETEEEEAAMNILLETNFPIVLKVMIDEHEKSREFAREFVQRLLDNGVKSDQDLNTKLLKRLKAVFNNNKEYGLILFDILACQEEGNIPLLYIFYFISFYFILIMILLPCGLQKKKIKLRRDLLFQVLLICSLLFHIS